MIADAANHDSVVCSNKRNKDSKVALVTGITGQDGAYLAELLLEKVSAVWVTHQVCTIHCLIPTTAPLFRERDSVLS
jgi:hypothetical protein